MLTVVSLGAGVQSSTLCLMAAQGLVDPLPDAAIFADTLAEPKAVYEWLDWLIPRLPFPVYRVQHKAGLLAGVMQPLMRGRFASPPLYTESATGGGQLRRQCTKEFKVEPIQKKLRELLGIRPRRPSPKVVSVSLWLGISLDEVVRMKPSREPWIEHRWPLVEARMTRADCLVWMKRHGYPRPPRSACVFCPYHSDNEWRMVRANADDWQTAVSVDELVRDGIRNTTERLYLHRSLQPLVDVDLATEQERGQLELWGNECEGLCNV